MGEIDGLVSRKNALWTLAKHQKKLKLCAGERDAGANGVVKLADVRVEPPSARAQIGTALFGFDRYMAHSEPRPASSGVCAEELRTQLPSCQSEVHGEFFVIGIGYEWTRSRQQQASVREWMR